MVEPKIRMLRKDGKGQFFHWNEVLARRGDMVEVMVTANEIAGKPPEPPKPPPVTLAEKLAEIEKVRPLRYKEMLQKNCLNSTAKREKNKAAKKMAFEAAKANSEVME